MAEIKNKVDLMVIQSHHFCNPNQIKAYFLFFIAARHSMSDFLSTFAV
jgi:hypothetical protein